MAPARTTGSPSGSGSGLGDGDGDGHGGARGSAPAPTSASASASAPAPAPAPASAVAQQPAAVPRAKGRPRGFRRDRDCRTCKSRNVKCDLNRPSCGICVAAGVPCQGYATTVRWANSKAQTSPGAPSPAARKSASTSRSPFSPSPSSGLASSRSPSLSQSSAASPPDLIFRAHHPHQQPQQQQQQQQQQQFPDPGRGINGISSDCSSSIASPSLSVASSLPPLYSPDHHHQHHHHDSHDRHLHVGNSGLDSPLRVVHFQNTVEDPLSVRPDRRAQLLVAALEENPDDSNWTTHYLKYYEFFTSQFDKARRSITKERRYRPQPDASTPSDGGSSSISGSSHHAPPQYPSVDRDLRDVWQLLYQRLSGQIPPGTTAALTGSSDDADPAIGGSSVELLRSHAAALSELNAAIKAGDILAIYGVVTLSFLDVYEGPFIDCQWHMHGARALLQLHCHDARSLNALCGELAGLREAVSLLSWYDTMGFYFEQNRRNALVFPDWVRDAMRDDFFTLVSCPRDAYMVYAAVVKARTAHRGRKDEDDADVDMSGAATGTPVVEGEGEMNGTSQHQHQQHHQLPHDAPPRYREKMKLSTLATQQILRISTDPSSRDEKTRIMNDSFRYAAALIAAETAHAGQHIDDETSETLGVLADRVCDLITLGKIPITSGKYRHFACQVTILGHHAKTPRHRQAVDGYWTRCDTLARPIYPIGRSHSGSEEHWTRILGTSANSSSSSSS